ncbi:unnamed protein product, partial [Acanthocheilonema viteae]
MLPFIGSITSNCCSILTQQEISREDLDGGTLTIIGLTMANKNNTNMQMSKESYCSDHLRSFIDDGGDNIDNNMIESANDILHFQRTLTRSAESLHSFGIKHLQSSTLRRHSHNLNNERHRTLVWVRPTREELMARASRRVSDEPKLLHHTQYDPVR